MKKFYIFAVVCLFVVSMNAQQIDFLHNDQPVAPKAATEAEARLSAEQGALSVPFELGNRSVAFAEDFANGFDGNNGIGAWQVLDSGGNNIWLYVDDSGSGIQFNGTDTGINPPGGEFSTNIGTLNSTTADNGWMIFDCDYYNTPIADGFEDVSGAIISPTIDMSELTSVLVTWEQYFRYCCFPGAPVSLGVSTDGGTSWVSFPANGSFIPSANVASANALTTTVDISCAAAGEAEVLLRWSYNDGPNGVEDGYSHYYWGIDDIVVCENENDFDLQVNQVTNGDVVNVWEYRVTPIDQAITAADGGLYVSTMYTNSGFTDQEDVMFTIEILDDGGTVLSTTTDGPYSLPSSTNNPMCPQNLQDTLNLQTGWVPTATGEYTLRTTMSSGATDATPENNVMEKIIVYTDDEYGHDDEADEALDTEFAPRESDIAGIFEPTGYGNFYHCPNSGSTCYGATVRFGPGSTGPNSNNEFEVRLYNVDPDNGLNGTTDIESSFWAYDPAWGTDAIYFPFDDPIDLNVGNTYFLAVINELESEYQLTVLGNGDTDTDNSTGVYELSGGGDFVWFTAQTASPAVRMIMAERVAIDEVTSDIAQVGQNIPNPADLNTTINLTLDAAKSVAFEIRDVQGKLVSFLNHGTLSKGAHQMNVDTSSLDAGVYTYSFIIDGQRITRKMVIKH